MSLWAALASLCPLIAVFAAGGGAAWAGRYISYVERVVPCEDGLPDSASSVSMRLSRFQRSQPWALQRVSGNVTIRHPQGIDDSNWIRARLDSKTSTDWKKRNGFEFNFKSGGCSALRDHMPDLARIAYGDIIKRKPCHIPPNTYVFEDQPVNWTNPKFPVMPFGFWRFHFTLGRDRDTLTCTNFEVHIIPAPRGTH